MDVYDKYFEFLEKDFDFEKVMIQRSREQIVCYRNSKIKFEIIFDCKLMLIKNGLMFLH